MTPQNIGTEESTESTPPEYFQQMYAENDDPWRFATNEYELQKYAMTMAALPRAHYENAMEIGCSIGVLTEQLAPRCGALLAIDVVEKALVQARARCRAWPHVEFRRMHLPAEYPVGSFDLVVLSEVGYYWSERDLALARERIVAGLAPGGHLVLVHWTKPSPDYPLTGDRVHQKFIDRPGDLLRHLGGQRANSYRLDVFARN